MTPTDRQLHRGIGALIRERDEARRERDQLRDELARRSGGFEARIAERAELLGGLDRLKAELALARAERDGARRENRVDGELLEYLIVEACPWALRPEAAEQVALNAVTELDRIGPGVRVFRGHPSRPWRPQPLGDEVPSLGDQNPVTDGCNTVTPADDHRRHPRRT